MVENDKEDLTFIYDKNIHKKTLSPEQVYHYWIDVTKLSVSLDKLMFIKFI